MNILSRNTPVAFVVGVAGTLGSCLVEKLLAKNVQVIGIDNLHTGKNSYIQDACKDRKFHFLNQNAAFKLDFDFPRLDYGFFLLPVDCDPKDYKLAWNNFLHICQRFKTKILLVSSIEAYDPDREGLEALKDVEQDLAKQESENKLNARVVRLAALYGPRMNFRFDDPIIKLIHGSILGQAQREVLPLDFITRAIFVEDAADLLIKAMLHSGTAHKIYDGALHHPIKISEVRQVLLDPVWHENQEFKPTELPPWPTPNLGKTHKELNWKTKKSLIAALKETLVYFKDNPDQVPSRAEISSQNPEKPEPVSIEPESKAIADKPMKSIPMGKWLQKYSIIAVGLVIISYGLIYPLFNLGWETIFLKQNIAQGNFEKASQTVASFKNGGVFQETLQTYLGAKLNQSRAEQSFNQAIWSLNGEKEGNFKEQIGKSESYFSQTSQNLNSLINIQQSSISRMILGQIIGQEVLDNLTEYQKSVSLARELMRIMPTIFSNNKSYLVILRDNSQSRTDGGKVIAQVTLSLENNILKPIINDPKDNFAQKLENYLEAGAVDEISPESEAKLILNFYEQQTKKLLDGVISLDLTTLLKISEQQDLTSALNTIFFGSSQDWQKLSSILKDQINQKHLSVYFVEPEVLAVLEASGWIKPFPKQVNFPKGEKEIFLAVFGSVAPNINIVGSIDESDKLNYQLSLDFKNISVNTKDKLKIYLPAETVVKRVVLGETDITNKLSYISDYGRVGVVVSLDKIIGEDDKLAVEYQDPQPINFDNGKVMIKTLFYKQPGIEDTKFNFKLQYPTGFRVVQASDANLTLGEANYTSNFTQDLLWKIVLNK